MSDKEYAIKKCENDCEKKLLKCKNECDVKLFECKKDCEEKLFVCKNDFDGKLSKCETDYQEKLLKVKQSASPEYMKTEELLKPSPMPYPPKGPLKAYAMADGSVELHWKPPLKIEGMKYRVEKQIVGETEWKRINETVEIISSDIKLQVKSLEKNKMYNFRIISQNSFGSSEPLETKKPIQVGIVYDMDFVETLEVKDYKCIEAVGLTYFV